MFDEPTEAVVNTVNCVGVMGKGVALEFKRRWPDNFKAYKRMCDEKKLAPGRMFIFDNNLLDSAKRRILINFPTKQHWRSQSKIEYIKDGLIDLVQQIRRLGIKSVVLPPLGCGNGGLEWAEVKPLIEDAAGELPEVSFVVFHSDQPVMQSEQSDAPLNMTTSRASMMVAFTEFEKYFGGHLTKLTAQKITYFLQILGIDFGLTFAKNKFGPYSDDLHRAFKIMEARHYIEDYTRDDCKIVVTQGARAVADEHLKSEGLNISNTIKKLSLLIDGYESPYGMELLSSVHFLSVSEGINAQPDMSMALEAWSDHKRDNFPEPTVTAALERLKGDGFIN